MELQVTFRRKINHFILLLSNCSENIRTQIGHYKKKIILMEFYYKLECKLVYVLFWELTCKYLLWFSTNFYYVSIETNIVSIIFLRLQNLPNQINFKTSPLEKRYGNFFSSIEEENQFCQEILTFVENNNERSFDTNNPIQSVSK